MMHIYESVVISASIVRLLAAMITVTVTSGVSVGLFCVALCPLFHRPNILYVWERTAVCSCKHRCKKVEITTKKR